MDIDAISNLEAKEMEYIGERLKEIREELKERDDTENKHMSPFSMTSVAKRMNMNLSTLANVERGSSIANSLKLIIYYYTLGYNPIWVIVPDNEFIPMRNVSENMVTKNDVRENYSEFEDIVNEAMKAFKASL